MGTLDVTAAITAVCPHLDLTLSATPPSTSLERTWKTQATPVGMEGMVRSGGQSKGRLGQIPRGYACLSKEIRLFLKCGLEPEGI